MARRLIQSDSVFLDSAYAIALASATDEFHLQALALADELEASGTRLLTTWAVLLEIGNALAKVQYRHAAIQLLSSLRTLDGDVILAAQAAQANAVIVTENVGHLSLFVEAASWRDIATCLKKLK